MLHYKFSEVVKRASEGLEAVPRPIQATVNVTSRCNSHCVYCTYGGINYHPSSDLDFFEIAKLFKDLANFGVRSLSISGGEPFLRKDLEELIQVATTAGLAVTVITNGTLLTLKRAQKLAAVGLKNLIISFDTAENRLYRTIRGISVTNSALAFKELQEYRRSQDCIPRIAISVVLTKLNCHSLLHDLEQYLPLLGSQDCIMIQAYQPPPSLPSSQDQLRFHKNDRQMLEHLCQDLICHQAQGWKIGNSTDFLERLPGFLAQNILPEGYKCLTAYSSLFIKENFDVHPCWQMLPVGNLRRTSLQELWSNPDFSHARREMERLRCRKCALVCHDAEALDLLAELVNYEPFPKI